MAAKPHYSEVNPNPEFPVIEETVLAGWKKDRLFQRSIDNRKDAKEFIFYDGPPFANGLPHYGHLLTGFVKDLFARYQTMRGKKVERRFGWDCHGLPAEMGSEKELGISGRAAIQNFGIDKFNEHCRTSVMKYTQEWEDYVTRQARWVDFKNDYKTMDINFMESVLWAFKRLYDKGLVYEAYRVMPYSWAAETPLSNFETKLDNSYREREDKAITVAFELNTPPAGAPKADKYYVLAWTTTPWTLPSNLALAVNKEITYCYALSADKKICYIASQNAFDALLPAIGRKDDKGAWGVESLTLAKGSDLLGLSYHPLFPYFSVHKHAFKILDGSSFVTNGDGTGIVHMAPGFGEEDQKCSEANGIEVVVPVDGTGKYTDEIYDIPYPRHSSESWNPEVRDSGLRRNDEILSLKGLNVIAEPGGSKFGLANDRIIDYLKATGQLIKQEQIKHNYPHCWRTDQPLIYRAMPSWYVEVTKFRDRAVELNKQINWIPEHIRDGQMGHMLATAPDWSISRNRFWGTPIPVWRSKSGKIKVLGSIEEIEKISGKKVTDLHRPYIDEITFTIDGEEYGRVDDVFDCWFESGSMPFAQVHYPFENKQWFEEHFPADFITEYVGQTRGWFNTLIMLSTALFDKPPFKNCVCHGVVLDSETGLKYSKRLKNYKDPMEVMDKFGADALRWLMISSPVMRGQDLSVDPEGKFIRDVVRLAIKPIWNAYNFFTLYANADGIKAKFATDSKDVMDRYILAKCKQAVEIIQKSLDAYDTPSACDAVMQFFEALNNWYIRRNKERFWKTEQDADKQSAYDTLYSVLTTMCKAAAPLLPLTLDDVYKGLTGEQSVHLAEFPSFEQSFDGRYGSITRQMDEVRDICTTVHGIRNNLNIRVRQPLLSATIYSENGIGIEDSETLDLGKRDYYTKIITDEVNIKNVVFSKELNNVATKVLEVNARQAGKRKTIAEKMKVIIPASKKGDWKLLETGDFYGLKLATKVEVAGAILENTYSVREDGETEYEFSIKLSPKNPKGAAPLSTNDALVILDTTITPELEAEGIARDLVRMIQQARKDAKLNVSDRILLSLESVEAIVKAATVHKGYIEEQTLAKTLEFKLPATSDFTVENDLDEHKVTIAISKVA